VLALNRIRMVFRNRSQAFQWKPETGSKMDLREKTRDKQADKQKQTGMGVRSEFLEWANFEIHGMGGLKTFIFARAWAGSASE